MEAGYVVLAAIVAGGIIGAIVLLCDVLFDKDFEMEDYE
jgi:hypothetical protein